MNGYLLINKYCADGPYTLDTLQKILNFRRGKVVYAENIRKKVYDYGYTTRIYIEYDAMYNVRVRACQKDIEYFERFKYLDRVLDCPIEVIKVRRRTHAPRKRRADVHYKRNKHKFRRAKTAEFAEDIPEEYKRYIKGKMRYRTSNMSDDFMERKSNNWKEHRKHQYR